MLKTNCPAVRAASSVALGCVVWFAMTNSSSAQLSTILLDLQIQTQDTPTLRFHQFPLVLGVRPEYTWDVSANHESMVISDITANTDPIVVEAGAGSNTLYIARGPDSNPLLGDVGIGTTTPRFIASPGSHTPVGGRNLHLKAAVGAARFIVEGQTQADTWFVHSGGAVDQKILRSRLTNGVYFMSTVPDTAAGEIDPYIFCIRLATGNVGIRNPNPAYPLQVGYATNGKGNGAHVTDGGVWTNASSRSVKQDIELVTSDQAREAVRALEPVSYRYKGDSPEQYVGFIAEDVPELVATQDRKGLAPMDIVAVLTKFVQDQDRQLSEQREINAEQQRLIKHQERMLESLNLRMEQLEKK